jgi:hypothetical protein
MGQRPPRTSYGYLPPVEARARGWECNNEGCGTGDRPAPRSWPFPCRLCGRPTDAIFEEPWAHEARFYKIRHDLTSTNEYRRETAQIEQYVWAYKDACFRDDRAAAEAAWQAYRRARPSRRRDADNWWITSSTLSEMVRLASGFGDIDRAAYEVLECYPLIDTRDVDDDNARRTIARSFVSMCITVLEFESSIDHPCEAELYAAMRDIADRAESVLMDHHHRGFQRIGELRAFHRSRAAISRARRSPSDAFDGLPAISWVAVRGEKQKPPATEDPHGLVGVFGLNPWLALTLADAAIDTAETHGDTGPLDDLVRRLDAVGTYPGLTHLVRARLHVVTGDLPAAVRELELGARATDFMARHLRPQILATQGMLRARIDPGDLDDGIARCRAGRAVGLRWWRRVTPADAALARLLLWRALQAGTPLAPTAGDVREAVRLIRRRCRLWRIHGADDRLLLQEVFAARDALTGRRSDEQRHRAWRNAVDAPWSTTARARLAVAWAEWAVGTGDPELGAEAYEHLVALVSQDAIARYGAGAKQRVLAAAQEYAEEAGYWLARTGRYREAVLALETGRAVGLTEVLGRDNAAVLERLRAVGRVGLADEYRRAIEDFDEQERHPSPALRRAWTRLRDVARRVAEATGADPLAFDVSYDDISAETGDGALVYLCAAKAGGYALVVAATHDPQFIDLPKLDRAAVAGIIDKVLPATDPSTGFARFGTANNRSGRERDAAPVGSTAADPMADGLRRLWNDGVKDVLFWSARGRVVTLIPVGLLSLLPLHASGEPGTPGDRYTEGRHAGNFSAIRYAPNARGLRRCRDTARELAGREQTLLAIDVPDGDGVPAGGHLRYVARETAEITRRWTGRPARPTHACTWPEFRATAHHHTVWHLACHGSAEPGAIMNSRLYFADRQVTLEELRRTLTPSRRRLAVLSACQTNLTGSAMPNEAVGLPSVLIQVGFAGVIATSWAVDDLATTYLMIAFYQRWCRDSDEPAVALNRAQQWLRAATRAELTSLLPDVEPRGGPGDLPYVDPRYWAAFAYTGA